MQGTAHCPPFEVGQVPVSKELWRLRLGTKTQSQKTLIAGMQHTWGLQAPNR